MQRPDDDAMPHATPAGLANCIQECQRCHNICLQTIAHCLQKGGQHAEPSHIRLLMDCVEICQTSANFMLRNSPLHTQTCAVCADVCEQCADICEQMGDDKVMMDSAAACQRCAESCREMASMAM